MTRIRATHGREAVTGVGACFGDASSPSMAPRVLSADLDHPLGDTNSDRSDVGLMTSEADDTEPPMSGERGDPPDVLLVPTELAVVLSGARVALTRTQFSIFSYFYENAGRWVSPNELIRHVLGTHHQPDTSLVRVHVHAIRRRLGEGAIWLESDPRRVRGYRWTGPGIAQSEVS